MFVKDLWRESKAKRALRENLARTSIILSRRSSVDSAGLLCMVFVECLQGREREKRREKKDDKWNMFTHERRWSLRTRRKWLGGSASASSITVNPWSMPVTIKEISFHRSLNNRSIKLSPLFSGAFYMQIAPSISARWLLQAFVKWVFMYHHFYETFPRATKPASIRRVTKRWGLLNTISHAIYVFGMWCTESNLTARKIYIMWMR